MYSSTLQNSVRRPSAARRAVSARSVSNGAPCKAVTPSSASISCCRIRRCSARSVISEAPRVGFGSTTGASFSWEGDMHERYPLCRAPTSAMAALRRYRAEPAGGRDTALAESRFGRWIKGLDPGGKRSTSALAPNGPTPDITASRGRCGRSSRQPGQIRKEAAVTNSLRVMPVSHPFRRAPPWRPGGPGATTAGPDRAAADYG